MAFPFAIPIAATIGGYAIDKMMGGNGMTGAGVGLSAGTMGADGGKGATAGAATTAGGTTPALLASTNAGAVAPGVFEGLSLGAGGYDAAAGGLLNSGSANLGSQMASQLGSGLGGYSTSIPTATGKTMSANITTPDTNLFDMMSDKASGAYDYLSEGISEMPLSDKASLGITGYQALGQRNPTPTKVSNAKLLQSNYQKPEEGLLDISAAGTNAEYSATTIPQNLSREQLEELRLNEQFGL